MAGEGRDPVPRLRFGLLCSADGRLKPASRSWQAADDMVEERFAAKGKTKATEPADNRGELPGFCTDVGRGRRRVHRRLLLPHALPTSSRPADGN